jgi:LEA14-like dessication related protein
MNNYIKIAAVIFVSLLLIGGAEAALGIYAFKSIEASYKSKSFFINKIDTTGVQMEVTLIVKNPSPFSLIINGYDLIVSINGAKIATLKSATPKEIKGNQYSNLNLPITVNWKNSFPQGTGNNIFNYFILKEYEKIVLNISGKFSGSTLKIPVNKNININYSLKEIQELIDSPTNK